MLKDHVKLCMDVLLHLESDEIKYPYFRSPAITALSDEDKIRYNELIENPRDLGLIKEKLNNGEYSGIAAFREDVELCFENSKKFCKGKYKDVYQIAVNYQKKFRSYIEKLLSQLSANNTNTQQTNTSTLSVKTKQTKQSKPLKPQEIIKRDNEVLFINYSSKCDKILKELTNMAISRNVFMKPVDSLEYPDYASRIPEPIDFSIIIEKVNNSTIKNNKNINNLKYEYLNEFSSDIRKMISNFIRYNYVIKSNTYRKQVINLLMKFEKLWLELVSECKAQYGNDVYFIQHIPEFPACLDAIEDIIKVPSCSKQVDPKNPRYAIDSFMDPVSLVLAPDLYETYKEMISNPIDYGIIISKLVEAKYNNISEVFADIHLVSSNCRRYWTKYGGETELEYIEDAEILEETFRQSFNNNPKRSTLQSSVAPSPVTLPAVVSNIVANTSSSSNNNIAPANNAVSKKKKVKEESNDFASISNAIPVSLPPQNDSIVTVKEENPKDLPKRVSTYLSKLFRSVLDELKSHYLPGIVPGSKIYSATPFLKAVDPIKYPDYSQIVLNPMDLTRIDKRVSGNRYNSIESFLSDIILVKSNADLYNVGQEGLEVRIMADAVYQYTKYLLKSAIIELQLTGDEKLINAIVNDYIRDNIINVRDEEKVIKYLDTVEKETSIRPRFYVDMSLSNQPYNITTNNNDNTGKLKKKIDSKVEIKVENKIDNKMDKVDNKMDNKVYKKYDLTLESKIDNKLDTFVDDIGDDFILFEDIESSNTSKISNKNKSKGKVKGKNKSKSMEVLDNFADNPMDNKMDIQVDTSVNVSNDINNYFEKPLERQQWENDCETVLTKLIKHPYIDTNNKEVISNFFIPVVETYPSIAKDYLAIVKKPMDLFTLKKQLDSSSILDKEEFYEKVVSIFQNAYDYSISTNQSSIIFKYKTLRYKYLTTYTQWLCLETLPVKDDIKLDKVQANKLGTLRLSIKLSKRKEREELLTKYQINRSSNSKEGLVECDKLLKAIKRTRNKNETAQLENFLLPFDTSLLADYYVYVRKPMDLATIKYRLDGTLPYPPNPNKQEDKILKLIQQHKLYTNYSDFVGDLRRVFDNAIAYNTPHIISDTTGLSQKIVDAAIFYKEKLENLLGNFTLRLIDKLEIIRLKKDEELEEESRKRNRIEDIEQDVLLFQSKEKEKLIAEDSAFAADLNPSQRHAMNRQQEILQRLEKKKQVEEHWNNSRLSNDLDILDDDDLSDSANPTDGTNLAVYTQRIVDKRHNQLAIKTQLPIQFVRFLDSKVRLRDLAWKKWEHLAKKSKYIEKSNIKQEDNVMDTQYDDNNNDKKIDRSNSIEMNIPEIKFSPIGYWDEPNNNEEISNQITSSNLFHISISLKRKRNVLNILSNDMDLSS